MRGIKILNIANKFILIFTLLILSCIKNPTSDYNVIIISIDTLRPDHIRFFGYDRDTTPNIDKLLKKGTVFEPAITPRPKTTPSIASMLTGLYPHRHGVRNLFQPLGREITTLPEVLKKHNYKTAAFIGNYVLISELSGLEQGFDIYDDFVTERELNREIYERNASTNVRPALDWLKKNYKDKFFLWIHFQDPHGPLTPPEPYSNIFKNPVKFEIEKVLIPEYQRIGNLTDLNRYIDLYDGEIRFMDYHIGQLINEVKELGIFDKTMIIFTADHGESLNEHNYYLSHGSYIYDACSKIPLGVILPDIFPKNRIVEQQVSLIDIFPTVLDVLDIEDDYECDGESLLPIAQGRASHSPYTYIEKINILKSIRTDKWKLIFTLDKKREIIKRELYYIQEDKAETKNLIGKYPALEKELGEKLKSWINLEPEGSNIYKNFIKKENRIYAPKKKKLTKEEKRRLKSLGYIK